MDTKRLVEDYIGREIEVLRALDRDCISRALDRLAQALDEGGDVYVFGNGGSAATASHFANDFNKGVSGYADRKFRFHCLNDNVPTITAIANDIGYEEIFRHQLEGRIKAGDIVMAISGSGNSENVVRAAAYAKERGAFVIALTGFDGGKLKAMADLSLHADVDSMQITEDVHLMFDHLMMSVLCAKLCGEDSMG